MKKLTAILFACSLILMACNDDEGNTNNATNKNNNQEEETESHSSDTPKVDGVSDEIYEQLVQFYFFTEHLMNIQTDKDVREKHPDQSWITEHELYEEAEKYAEENNVLAREVFPNPLMLEYMRDSGAFNNTEQKYIEKMDKFLEASQRVKVDDYEKLKDELKEDLRITDSYNMFETVK